MGYEAVRDWHFVRAGLGSGAFRARRPELAVRVHAALIRAAARQGVDQVLGRPAQFVESVRGDLGLGGWLAPLFQAALWQLLRLLLPIFLQWLEDELAGRVRPGSEVVGGDRVNSLDARLCRLAEEAGQ